MLSRGRFRWRKLERWLLSSLIALALLSCTPWREAYLREAVNRATQDDVTKRLGPPHSTRELTTGATVWTYQYRYATLSRGGHISGHSYCKEYILTFEREGSLREWRVQDC